MRLPIRFQRDIVQQHLHDPTQSARAIARAVNVSTNSVLVMLKLLGRLGEIPPNLFEMDDDEWTATLGNKNKSVAARKVAPDWKWVAEQMQRKDATLEQLWREWREQYPNGIGYSQFTHGYRKWTKSQHIVMRKVHRPGEKLFVDFAGRTVEIRSRDGGPSIQAQIFVAVLGYSNYTFVYAVTSQNTANWVKCHMECFAAMGGVPQWVIPDNLKAAVLSRGKGKIVLNQAYKACLAHFGTAARPTGSREPTQKAKAEVGVQIVQRWMLFPMRDWTFFSVEELNAELKGRTAFLNAHPFKRMPGSRLQRFEDKEHATLKALPSEPYEPCDWRYGIRAGDDYHVEHGRSFYSVPSEMRGQRVDLRYSTNKLEIFFKSRRIALHEIAKTVGEVSTHPEHRPVAHTRVLEGEPKALLQWAESVGPNAFQMIQHHLQDRSDALNGLRAARRMREMARHHGQSRFEETCAYALRLNITTLRSIESILKKSPDKTSIQSVGTTRPGHSNLRGADYYREAA